MARLQVEQETFPISLSTFVCFSSNPIFAGACRGYDIATFLDTNLPKIWPVGSVAVLEMAPA